MVKHFSFQTVGVFVCILLYNFLVPYIRKRIRSYKAQKYIQHCIEQKLYLPAHRRGKAVTRVSIRQAPVAIKRRSPDYYLNVSNILPHKLRCKNKQ
jgi:hypothetical protein